MKPNRPIRVEVPNRLLDKCRDYGEAVVKSYAAGHNPRSRTFVTPGNPIFDDVNAQMMGKVCECAGAIALGLEPDEVLNWTSYADKGFDFQYREHFPDVKGTWHPYGKRMIWPIKKNHFFHTVPATLFILVRAKDWEQPDFGLAWALGWVTKEEFFEKKIEAVRTIHNMVDGTWFMDSDNLEPMETLIGPRPDRDLFAA